MRRTEGKRPATLIQHYGEPKRSGDPVTPPIVQTSLFVFDTVDELWAAQADPFGPPYDYSRLHNPTLEILESKVALLEGTERCKVFGSGMGAISAAVMSCVQSGSHVVALDTCYGPTRLFLRDYLPRFGVETTFVTGDRPESFLDALRPNTACVYLESPGSVLFRIVDLQTVAEECRRRGVTTIHDNSYATPLFQRPAELGVDIVVHSATKYLSGHSDVCAGALCTDSARMAGIIQRETALYGAILAPFPAWLMLRGLRTLPMRMTHAERSGNEVAAFLRGRPEVEDVFHAGDAAHPGRALAARQMSGTSSLLSFVPARQEMEWAKRFVEALDVFQIGVSWGGFESLAVPILCHPMDWPEPKWVVRLYCGFEDPRDLTDDLSQAFRTAS